VTLPTKLENGKFTIGQKLGTTDNVKFNTVEVNSLPSTGIIDGKAKSATAADSATIVTNSSQTNITKVGTLSELIVDGQVTFKQAPVYESGVITEIQSNNIVMNDPIITLSSGEIQEGLKDRGLEFKYSDEGTKLGFMGYDQSKKAFKFIKNATNDNENITGDKATIIADIQGDLTGTANTVASLTGLSTDDLTEGSNNKYFKINDVKVYLENAVSDVNSGIDMIDNKLTIGQAVKETSDVKFNKVTANEFKGNLLGKASTADKALCAALVTNSNQFNIKKLGTLESLEIDGDLTVNGTVNANFGGTVEKADIVLNNTQSLINFILSTNILKSSNFLNLIIFICNNSKLVLLYFLKNPDFI
jgi:hypothetical protein